MQRLDKILSDAGVASRKELRGLIRAGRVCADGRPALRPEEKFDETAVEITVDGAPVEKLHTGADPGALPALRGDAGRTARQGDGGAAAVYE